MDPILNPPPEAASVVAALRQLIVEGRYPPGTRLAEIPVAQALGVSRTPVRLAFRTLEQEGLLEKTGKRGLVVRAFTQADVLCGIEVRGVLEGLAARRLAEACASPGQLARLQACLDEGEAVLSQGTSNSAATLTESDASGSRRARNRSSGSSSRSSSAGTFERWSPSSPTAAPSTRRSRRSAASSMAIDRTRLHTASFRVTAPCSVSGSSSARTPVEASCTSPGGRGRSPRE